MWKQHTRRRQRQTAQGRPRRQAEHAAPGSADSALAGVANRALPEIAPPPHSCAAQLSGAVASMRERQVRVAVHGSGVLRCRLNSVSPDGDGAARRWGCNHRTLVSARAMGENNLRDSGTASGNLGQGHLAINR
jgi:hypothetical protein